MTIFTSEAVVSREPEVIGRANNPRGGRTLAGSKARSEQVHKQGYVFTIHRRGQRSNQTAAALSLSLQCADARKATDGSQS